MLDAIQYAFNYLIYFLTSGNKHSVHSPFVYDFVCKVLNVRKNKPIYHDFELVRSKMLKSDAEIKLLPLGAAAAKDVKVEKLKKVAARTSKSAKYAELLERICDAFQPEIALEIGTSLGMSTLYQASAIPNGYLFTLEGNPDSAKVARHNFEKLGFNNIQLVEGEFDRTIPMVLEQLPRLDYVFFDGNHSYDATMRYFEWCKAKAHNNTVFVFDDIRWSHEMEVAWNKIIDDPKVTVSIDLFAMGIVFFRQEQVKENFVIRY
jgi:predicted O-methyltransferase YrrM